MKLKAVFALVLFCSLPVLAQMSDPDAWDMWKRGDATYQAGVSARAKGRLDEAERALGDAKELYLRLKEARKDWNQEVIDKRIAQVESELKKIVQARFGEAVEEDIGASGKDGKRMSLTEQRMLRQEVEQYRARVVELVGELEAERRKGRQGTANLGDLENLLKENRTLASNLAALQRQKQALEQRLDQPDKEKDELRKLLIDAKISFDAAGRRIELLEKEKEDVYEESADAYRERNQLRGQVRDLTARLRSVENELTAVGNQRRYDDAEREAAAASLKSAENARGASDKRIVELESELKELKAKYLKILESPELAGSDAVTALTENIALHERVLELKAGMDMLESENVRLNDQRRANALEITQLTDSLATQARQISALTVELELAQKHIQSDTELLATRDTELTTLRERTGKLEGDLLALSTINAEQKTQLDGGSHNIQNTIALNVQLREAAGKLAAAEGELEVLRSHAAIYEKNLAELNDSIKRLTGEASGRATAEETATQLAEQLKNSSAELATALSELETLRGEKRIADEKLAELPELQQKLVELQRTVQESGNSEAVIAELRGDLTVKESLVTELKSRITKLDAELENAAQMLRDLSSGGAAKEEIARIAEQRKQQEARLAELRRSAEEKAVRAGATQAAGDGSTGGVLPGELVANHLSGGRNAESRGAVEVALFHYRKALELAPNNIEAIRSIGLLEFTRGNINLARPLLARAVAGDSANHNATAAYAAILLADEQYGNVLAMVEPLLATHKDDYALRFLRGSALWRSGQLEAGEQQLGVLTVSHPEEPRAFIELATLLAANHAERLDEAANYYIAGRKAGGAIDSYLEKSLADYLLDDSETVSFLLASAEDAYKAGEFEQSVWFHRQIVELRPHDRLAQLRLALAQINATHASEAAELLAVPETPTAIAVKLIALAFSGTDASALLVVEPNLTDSEGAAALWPRIAALAATLPDGGQKANIQSRIEALAKRTK